MSDLIAGDRTAILIAVAVYFAVAGLWSLVFCVRVRQWPSTTGTLNASGLAKFGNSFRASDQDFRADVRFSYEVDGRMYEGNRLSPSIMIVSYNARALLRWQLSGIERIGETGVRVYYKPTNPRKSYLIVPSIRTMAIVAILMFGAAYLLYRAI